MHLASLRKITSGPFKFPSYISKTIRAINQRFTSYTSYEYMLATLQFVLPYRKLTKIPSV